MGRRGRRGSNLLGVSDHSVTHSPLSAFLLYFTKWYSIGNINWFAPMLQTIAVLAAESSIDLHISIYVTCLCDPGAVPQIPNSLVTMEKPTIKRILQPILSADDIEKGANAGGRSGGGVGGLAIAVSGPESLTNEMRNAVAGMSLKQRRRFGRVDVHTEVFAI